jgi:hypothetical protein
MSKQTQMRRGTQAEHETFTGAIGEVTVDTTNNTLRVHNGVTVGGKHTLNDLSQAHIFDTVALFTASTITFPVGKIIYINDDAKEFKIANGINLQRSIYNNTNTTQSCFNLITEYDLFVIYGQSNAVGFAGGTTGSTGRTDIPTDSFYWYNRGASTEWRPVEYDMPFIDGALTTTSTGNAWVEFAREYNERTGRGCLFIPAAYGGLSITELSSPSIHWNALVSAIAEVDADTTYNIVNKRMLWCQGESDMTDGTTQSQYLSLFVSLWNAVKALIGNSHCYISRTGNPRTRLETTRSQIQTAQDYICRNLDDVSIGFFGAGAFTRGGGTLRTDDTHYAQLGYNQMGYEMAKVAAIVESSSAAESYTDVRSTQFLMTPDDQIHHATVGRLIHDGTNWVLSTINDTGRWRSYCISSFSELSTALVVNTSIATADILTLGVSVNRSGAQHGIRASIRDGGTSGSLVVELYADTQALVDTSTGVITYPNGSDTGLLSNVSSTIGAGITKITYPLHQYSPVVSPLTSSALTEFIPTAQSTISATETWFKYQTTPTEKRAIVDFKGKPIDPSAVKLNGLELRIFCMIGDRLV